MPNIKSAIKRTKTSEARNVQNTQQKSAMRTAVKRFEAAVETNADNKNELLSSAVKQLDKAAQKGLIHKNNADRKKASLMKKANA
ncbi:30S ribosomal protein S20 [Jeotgalibacillus proteolyticus]|uniref:Small ribosomal subunit protein bS20 n=1 Tax=Jeotgalibacillus proteolyticus TaxID=2082395 RepID=A0A2S5GEL4_9BACL|nr:30S ribosomal protein S20 [Jeotgalibacillus proteolyticus]PPA71470.1 30S ribosomal protein S20 [Jeotgalibacillus proteolyticus]